MNIDQFPISKPLLDFKGKKNAVDELACFQEPQTLPLFVIRLKDNGLFDSFLVPSASFYELVCLFAASFTPMAEKLDMNANNAPTLPPSVAPAPVTATSGGMTRAEFEKLTTEGLIAWFATMEVVLSDRVQSIFREQEIDGDGLTGMSKEDLVSCQVPMGVASQIMKRIPK